VFCYTSHMSFESGKPAPVTVADIERVRERMLTASSHERLDFNERLLQLNQYLVGLVQERIFCEVEGAREFLRQVELWHALSGSSPAHHFQQIVRPESESQLIERIETYIAMFVRPYLNRDF
jgi:hypothetical protein